MSQQGKRKTKSFLRKQANRKNKPKMGNLIEKQAENACGRKIEQNKKTVGKLKTKAWR